MNFRDLIERGLKLRTELFWVVVGQFFGFVGSFIGIKVLTTVMGPKEYGELALGLTIAGLFNMYLYGPLANVVARFFAVYRERGELPVYFGVLKRSHLILAVTLSSLAALVGLVLYPWLGIKWAMIGLIATLYAVAVGINSSYISLQSAVRQRQVVALHQGADVWLRTGLAILLLYTIGANGCSALLGYALGTLLVTISQALFARKNTEIAPWWNEAASDQTRNRQCRLEFTGYAASFIGFAGFAAISMYADRWVIQGVFGAHEVGIYAAIYQIAAAPVNLLFAMINQLMVPIIFERAGAMTSSVQTAGSELLIRQTILVSAILSLFIIVISLLLGEPIIRILTSARYAEHHQLLWLTVTGIALFNVGQIFALRGISRNQPQIYLLPKGAQAAFFLALAYLLARLHGLPGVALALCLSSLVYLVAVIVTNRRLSLLPENL